MRGRVPVGFSAAQWTDWTWQLQHRIRTVEQLSRWVRPTDEAHLRWLQAFKWPPERFKRAGQKQRNNEER